MEKKVTIIYEGREFSPNDFSEELFKSESAQSFTDEDKAIIKRFWEIVEYPVRKK